MRTLAILLLAVLALLHGAARAQDTPVPEAVAPGVWMVQGQSALGSAANRNFISNAGFVLTNDGVVVIDALGSLDSDLGGASARRSLSGGWRGASGIGEIDAQFYAID